jgi:hypothetical protein
MATLSPEAVLRLVLDRSAAAKGASA